MNMNVPYEHDYRFSGVADMMHDKIPPILGDIDANNEWIDPAAAEANYINIDSYEQFLSSECIFLVGRYGSGKTSMLNKLKYSIIRKQNKEFNHALMIETKDHIAELGYALRTSATAEYTYSEAVRLAIREWEKTINILIMKVLYDKYSSCSLPKTDNIKSYLTEQGLLSAHFSTDDLLAVLTSALAKVENPLVQGAISLANHVEKYKTPMYSVAKKEAESILKQYGKLIVLIDSIEKYEFNDRITFAVINALVDLCEKYHRTNRYIQFKMALPSELIPRLLSLNPEKFSNEAVYIRWSHDDLKKLVSVRLYRYLHQINKNDRIDNNEALDCFDAYYEEQCMTRCGFKFPTFSYCMSHTLKEPRHILAIFNAWIYYEKKYDQRPRMGLIEKAIDNNAPSRVEGALTIYNNMYDNIIDIFEKTFRNRKYCFSNSDFDSWLAGCSKLRGNLEAEELKKCFISSGLVGTMIDLHNIKPGDSFLSVDRPIRIKEVIFEYQIKHCLPYNSETTFCLHPMVYEALNIEVDRNTFVYPRPIESGNEFIPWSV